MEINLIPDVWILEGLFIILHKDILASLGTLGGAFA